ncbi:unnamed protein product [Nippostrongylus brasiliensis]|uniref:Mitochondrial potassium channel n=1 Tax=Nippostrongylus brasiliensis TaxID=27835 RepID=A0A158QY44_NIPBR|nr:unnamed protein product [Nippostrongylus brasiliensis]
MLRGPRAFLALPRLCRSVSSVPVAAPTAAVGGLRQKLESCVEAYEDFIGIKAVKDAQAGVMMWEEKLSDAQLARREKQAEIKSLQSRLKEIHTELDRTSRGEDKVRASHERERERAEKTKWWSVSASLIGALLGIIGASIGNELRMRRLREMLPLGGAQMSEMARLVGEQNAKVPKLLRSLIFLEIVTGFMTEMRDALKLDTLKIEPAHSSSHYENVSQEKVIAAIREENARLSAQMAELTRLARLEASLNADPNAVVYVGSDMERLLDQTEKNLESKMKLQTLLSVVALYAAIGVSIPLVFALFRGG